MIAMRITPWVGAAAIAGLVLVNSAAVEAKNQDHGTTSQPPAGGAGAGTAVPTPQTVDATGAHAAATEDSLDDADLADIRDELEDAKAENPGVSRAVLRQKLMEKAEASAAKVISPRKLAQSPGVGKQLRTIVRSLLPPAPAPPTGPKPVPEQLDPTLRGNILTELWNLKGADTTVPPDSLRLRLMARAETLAAGALGIAPGDLAKYPRIIQQLWEIVYTVVPMGTPNPPETRKRSTGTRTYDDEDDDSPRRCECYYCHSLHAAGTCSLPYQPACLPQVPPMWTNAATPSNYMIPYAPRRHFLHGLFCPCSWCRGGW